MECGHLYTSTLLETELVEEAYSASGDWIKQTDISAHSGADIRYRRYISSLQEIIAPGARVIDIGCSKGRFLYQLQQHGFDCYGIEPSRDAEHAARLIGSNKIWRTSYNRPIPIAADVVTLFEVLEHIPEPEKTAAVIFQQLRPGGYFMGSIPSGEFIRAKVLLRRKFGIRSLLVPLIMDAGNHINYFSSNGIRKMLERSGFKFLWIQNAPLDFNFTANRLSPMLKRVWSAFAQMCQKTTGRLIGSNLWFLAQRP
jgi:SAM-dependent methyltransferase